MGERDSEADEIIYSIRRRLVDYIGPGIQSAKRLKEVFAEIDRNGNNFIDRNEFKYAFTILGIDLTTRDVNLIFDRFDRDHTNDFDYREFLELVATDSSTENVISEEIINATDKICSAIRKQIEEKYGTGFKKDMTVLDYFEQQDDHQTSRIYRKELLFILHDRLNITPRLSEEEVDLLFARFDNRRNSTTMDYRKFVDIITGRYQYQNLQEIMLLQTNEIIDVINEQLNEAFGDGAGKRRRLENVFNEYERKNRITRKDFIAILLDELAIRDLRVREIEYLFDRFDTTSSGTIDYKPLLDLLTSGSKPKSPVSKKASIKDVKEIIEAIRKALADEFGESINVSSRLKEVFAAIDRNGNSRLERSELQQAMEALKLELTPSELQLLLQKFDHDLSGNFDYKEFMELVAPKK